MTLSSAEASKFYVELVRALEWGKRKVERELVDELTEKFGVPAGATDPAAWLAANHAPEAVMGWLTSSTAPFARMLSELYTWLAEVRATIGGNVHEIAFDFASLQVRFPLDAFPKTYIQQWMDIDAVGERFQPDARGRVRIDVPNYWQDDRPALRALLQAVPSLETLPEPNQEAVAFRVRRLVEAFERHYAVKPAHVSANPTWRHGSVYVESEELWNELLALVPQSSGDSALPLHERMEEARNTGRIADAGHLLDLLDQVDRQGLGEMDVPADHLILHSDLEADDTHAFLSTYALVFPRTPLRTRDLVDVIDKVFLPFWRHRWRLFEIWSILWLRNVLPESVKPEPCLQKRDDEAGVFNWVLAGGDATSPVASKLLADRGLSIWFQLKTPLSDADHARFRQAHIEPDIRLRETIDIGERDLVILELKDRHLAKGSAEKRIGRMYATTGAPVVCVANYSLFGTDALKGNVYEETDGATTIYLVDSFQPGSTPDEVARAIRNAVGHQIDILIDVSKSMNTSRAIAALDQLPSNARLSARWCRWADRFAPAADERSALAAFDGSSTDFDQAIEAHSRLQGKRPALILTDADGAAQFDALQQRGAIDHSAYLCVNVDEASDTEALARWLGQRR